MAKVKAERKVDNILWQLLMATVHKNELKTFVGIPTSDTADDTLIDDAVNAASRQIDAFCGRYFYARRFYRLHVNFLPDDLYRLTCR